MILLTYTCFIAFGTYTTGALAMNLNNAILFTPNYGPFFISTLGTAAVAFFGGSGFVHYLKMKGLVPVEAPYRELERWDRPDDATASPLTGDARAVVNVQEFDDRGHAHLKQAAVRQLVADIVGTTSAWDLDKARLRKVALPESQKDGDGRAHGVGAIRIRVRDLRLLDYNTHPNSGFSIVVRRHSVLLSLDPIRAVVMANKVVLMVPAGGMDHIVTVLGGFMASWSAVDVGGEGGGADTRRPQVGAPTGTRSSAPASSDASAGAGAGAGAPGIHGGRLSDDDGDGDDDGPDTSSTHFEIHAYEAIFTTLSTLHAQQFKALAEDAEYVLQYFKQLAAIIIPQDIQERFQVLKTDLDVFVNRLKAYRRALTTLSEDDEAMALMNLSILRDQPWYYNAPLRPEILACHDEIEEMIESYLVEASSVLVRAENLVVKVRYISLGSQWAALWLPCD